MNSIFTDLVLSVLEHGAECRSIDCDDACDDTGDFEPGDDDYPLCTKCCNVCDIVDCKDDCDDPDDFEAGDDDAPLCNKCCGNIFTNIMFIISNGIII